MKKLVTSYTFDASAKTIDSADFTSLEKIQLITNVTDQLIIYNFADTGKGGTLAGTTLTLEYDTTAMDDADKLQIFVEDGTNLSSVEASLGVMDDWDESDRAKVNVIAGQAGITGGAGNVAANTPRVVLADDRALPAGDNNIGNVDVVTMPTVTIQDGGNTITVDGTVAVTGVATAANQTTVIGHLDGVEGLLGTIDADTGNISTKIDTIAGAIKAEDAAHTTADTGIMALAVRSDSLTALAGTSGDYIPLMTDAQGQLRTSAAGLVAQDAAVAGNPLVIGLRASAAIPTAMSTDGDSVFAYADRSGRQVVTSKAATSTLSNVSGSATNVTILASNTSRLGAVVYNDSTAILYLKFGSTASTTSFTYKMQPDATVEVPFGYTGVIEGLWSSATGSARVTELT